MKYYMLQGKTAVAVTPEEYYTWCEEHGHEPNRIVKQTTLQDGTLISTVLLILDHSYGKGLPLIFETMIFGGIFNNQQSRYHTYEQAEKHHDELVQFLNTGFNTDQVKKIN